MPRPLRPVSRYIVSDISADDSPEPGQEAPIPMKNEALAKLEGLVGSGT